jgi:chorismate mutase
MMNDSYLLVSVSKLPEALLKVVLAKEDISRSGMNVSDACRKEGISRSVFYKYRDYVFRPEEKEKKKSAVFSVKVEDKEGVLNSVLNVISHHRANVLNIYQNTPMHDVAFVSIKIDYSKADCSLEELSKELSNLPYVSKVEVSAHA